MDGRNATYLRWITGLCAALIGLATFAAAYWREDIIRASLDPKQPFQTYAPPAALDYGAGEAWFRRPGPDEPPALADVFFVHSTTFDGGRDWLGSTRDRTANRIVEQTVLPNYAGPFAKVSRVFAPRYRQASLYAYRLSQRDDAKEARNFAYGDVKRAFEAFLAQSDSGTPLVLVGVGQGAQLVGRLTREVREKPQLLDRIAAVYLMEEIIPQDDFPPGRPLPLCHRREEARCVVAWITHGSGRPDRNHLLERSLASTPDGDFVRLGARQPACVNPMTGTGVEDVAPRAANLGAANATGLRWPPAPRLLPGQVEAQCKDGLLSVSTPEAQELRPAQSWSEKLRPPGYNLFYADLSADVTARLSAWYGGPLAPGITRRVVVQTAPVHRISNR